MRTRLILLLAGPVMYLVSCTSPNDPVDANTGSVVFRFDSSDGDAAALSAAGGPSASFDSVAVRIFRPGSPLTQEVRQGAPIGVDPIEMTIGCIAESNKRVSVELFASRVMLYHGYAESVNVRAGAQQREIVLAQR
jgi:hypothetical protein